MYLPLTNACPQQFKKSGNTPPPPRPLPREGALVAAATVSQWQCTNVFVQETAVVYVIENWFENSAGSWHLICGFINLLISSYVYGLLSEISYNIAIYEELKPGEEKPGCLF